MKIPLWINNLQKMACASLLLPATSVFAAEQQPDHSHHHSQTQTQDEHLHDHGDDPVLTRIIIDHLELQNAEGANPVTLDAQLWLGTDLHKAWIKTDIEQLDDETAEAEIQALYSRAISPFWNAQFGVRHDAKPTPARDWGVLGLQGLAPYWLEIDTALFVGDAGRIAARFAAEYELLFTQRLILSPSIEVNVYGQQDAATHTGSGLADATAGLRLRYEIRREFAPYIGVNWHKKFGDTADFAEQHGESVSASDWVMGVRAWF